LLYGIVPGQIAKRPFACVAKQGLVRIRTRITKADTISSIDPSDAYKQSQGSQRGRCALRPPSSESWSSIACDRADRVGLTTSFFWRQLRRTYNEWRSGCAR